VMTKIVFAKLGSAALTELWRMNAAAAAVAQSVNLAPSLTKH
jgi:hypothetical protein